MAARADALVLEFEKAIDDEEDSLCGGAPVALTLVGIRGNLRPVDPEGIAEGDRPGR